VNRHRIARVAGVIVVVPVLAAGCSSSAKQRGKDTEASALAAKLGTSLNALKSAHLDIDAGSLGGTSTADVMLDNGQATATDVKVSQSAGQVEVVTVDGTSYAKRPPNTSDKPWVRVSGNSDLGQSVT
jgi:outer membrane murein-binding lipoprotein Lpp